MRQALAELLCWWRGHDAVPWAAPWGYVTKPGDSRLAFMVCTRCGRTLSQTVEVMR